MARHPLKREIIATHVTNSMINRVGSTFVHRLVRDDRRAAARGRARLPAEPRDLRLRAAVAGDRGARQQGRRRRAVGDADRHQPRSSSAARRGSCARAGWPTTWRRRSRTSRRASRRWRQRLPKLLDAGERARVDAAVARYVGAGRAAGAGGARRDVRHAVRDARHRRGRRPAPSGRSSWWPPIYFDVANAARLPWLREKIARAARRPALADARQGRDAGRPVGPAAHDHRRRCWPAAATWRAAGALVAAWQDRNSPRARARGAAARRTARGAGARRGDAVGGVARVAQPGLTELGHRAARSRCFTRPTRVRRAR